MAVSCGRSWMPLARTESASLDGLYAQRRRPSWQGSMHMIGKPFSLGELSAKVEVLLDS